MKKFILLVAITVFSVAASNAQTKKATKKEPVKAETPKVDGAGMLFENETIDYGTVPHNSDGKREFVFVNNGNKPLIIESTQGSCGCTVPTKPEKPIQPGERGVIGVKYDTSRGGQPFTKTVTVKSNATGQETKVLTIKGNVLAAPPADGTAPTKS
ncbi:MAG: DUF1573 domain-containing protein [Flavobacterium sp. JAD_PAG50586_2]|jgi:hypothetical protein|nr:MAG: DUF1573 domain-containing protein [Flavobacterium sp. JAD_PAG50586_2]